MTELEKIHDWIIENPPKFDIGDQVVFEDTTANNSFLRGIFYDEVKELPRPFDGSWLYRFGEHRDIPESSILKVEFPTIITVTG